MAYPALQQFRKAPPSASQKGTARKSANTIAIGEQEYTLDELRVLEKAGALSTGTTYKNNPGATTTANGPTLQGPFTGNDAQFGIFSSPGVRPERFSALERPLTFARMLIDRGGLQRSEYFNEVLEIMTGVTSGSGTNASSFCDNPPVTGQGKVMQRVFPFGQWFYKTTINAVPNVGRLRGRADIPGRILNQGPMADPLVPEIMYTLNDTRSQLQYELWRVGVALERSMEQTLILGNTSLANTNTHDGWIKEFAGLDSQIKTGYTDAVSGLTAPAADSVSVNFGASVGSTGANGLTIVQTFSDIYFALLQRAARVGMTGTSFVILMRLEFFRALTDVYACNYATARCTNTNAGQPQTIDQTYINELRLEMLNGQYLLIEGVKVPVVFTDGIPLAQTGANSFSNSCYIVPLDWNGQPLLRMEYFPMDNQYAMEYAGFLNAERYRVLNNGLYLVGYQSAGLCDNYLFASQMRMILETPYLAARIDNLWFSYVAQTRSPYPGETFSYANGGTTYRSPIFGSQ